MSATSNNQQNKEVGKAIDRVDGRLQSTGQKLLEGEIAFRLYDTYGFPIEFTSEILDEHRLNVDMERFQESEATHKEKSKIRGC